MFRGSIVFFIYDVYGNVAMHLDRSIHTLIECQGYAHKNSSTAVQRAWILATHTTVHIFVITREVVNVYKVLDTILPTHKSLQRIPWLLVISLTANKALPAPCYSFKCCE